MEKRMRTELHLPMEIAEIILSKLPTKSLLRFQTLSKSYTATIASPRFITTHSEQSRRNPSKTFLVRPKDKGHYCLAKFEDQKLRLENECSDLPSFHSSDFDSLCSCDDIVLFRRTRGNLFFEEYLLWNPINNTHRDIYHSVQVPLWSYGLCHDPTEGDYKIVLVFTNGTYAVHSCKHGTWTERQIHLIEIIRCFYGSSGTSVDGKLYWIGVAHPVCTWGLICFDPTHNGLSELESPQEGGFDYDRPPFLANLRGCLCFGDDSKDVIEFWMLRGGTWEKTICIDKRSSAADYLRVYVSYKCYVVEKEEIVIFTRDEDYILHNRAFSDREIARHLRSPLEDSEEDRPLALVLSLASFLA